ncbi:15-hydroxyprostaglandin dehydrogenase [NAD(+)]-like [Onthophagus taurus]|uniref:15-hydroxyprostaglandin dehydrogenase [NAD(+)]-like n=1 Tax=Onthophagus taurus TaxID=166361 RepID=UPI0039BE9410
MLVKGKVALISGGASGIGLACGNQLLKDGALGIALVDINEQLGISVTDDLNSKYGQGKVIFIKANVSNKNEFQEAFKKTVQCFNQLDIFLNNVGLFDEVHYENCLTVNLLGCIHGLKLAIDEYLPKYKSESTAIIINTSSMAGLVPIVGVEIYSTTKFAIIGLTRNFGCDYHYKRTGVKVIALCPGATDTPILDDVTTTKLVYSDRLQTLQEAAMNAQKPEDLAECFIRIIKTERNGSTWLVNEGKETEIEYPKLVSF